MSKRRTGRTRMKSNILHAIAARLDDQQTYKYNPTSPGRSTLIVRACHSTAHRPAMPVATANRRTASPVTTHREPVVPNELEHVNQIKMEADACRNRDSKAFVLTKSSTDH